MHSQNPAYYSRLGPFQKVFQTGNPILTYHKLGPRPARVRLKGLYVSQSLFQRQLEELRAAGYTSGSLQTAAGTFDRDRIVITFDDGYVNVLRYGLKVLAQNGFRSVQFIVANLLGKTNQWDVAVGEAPETLMDIAQIREWLAAGHEIGSHSLNHPYLTRISRSEAAEEIKSSRKKLEDLFGRPIQHFCYPYGDWDEVTQDLARDAGYKTACTTESGVNTSANSPFALRRFTARYPSRNLKAIWARIRSGCG